MVTAGRVAWLCAVVVPWISACADVWQFADLQAGTTADATAESAATAEAAATVESDGSDAREADAPVNQDCANARCADAGQCIDTRSDPRNCGGCGNLCSLPHGTSTCVASTCAIWSCSSGYADCDKIATTGCEVDVASDPNNCGGCGHACTLPHATASCRGGSCGISSCSPGYADCDLVAWNGCEVHTSRDPDNCGTCDSVCALPHATAGCSAGSCTIALCNAGFADCDGLAANGCETDLAKPSSCGGCGIVCAGGTPTCSASGCASGCSGTTPTLCSGAQCIDTTSNVNHCGACGVVCNLPHATSGCTNSNCVIVGCAAGYADCDGLPANGCEVHGGSGRNKCGG